MRYRYDLERVVRRWLSGEVIVAFLIATILLGIVTSAAYDLITIWSGSTPVDLAKVLVVTVLAGLVSIGFVAHRLQRARGPNPIVSFGGERTVTQGHRGLVLLVSNRDMARFAIRHHLHPEAGNRLERCWLICTEEMAGLCQELSDDFAPALIPDLELSVVPIEGAFLAPHVHQAVATVIATTTDPASEMAFTLDDLIVDITGGTKPMTAGAVLASTQVGVALQYVESRWERGAPVSGSQTAKIVEVVRAPANFRTIDETTPPTP